MIRRLIDFSLDNRLAVVALWVLLIAFGVDSALHLPIDAVPDITNVQVQVLTDSPGLSAEEVEQFVTFPVETAMSGLPRLEDLRSLTKFGLSVVTVVFEEGTDVYWARQQVAERLAEARATIPEGARRSRAGGGGDPRRRPSLSARGRHRRARAAAAPGGGNPRRRSGSGRRNRADAPRGELARRRRPRRRHGVRDHDHPAGGGEHRHLLRPLGPGAPHPADRGHQPARRRPAGGGDPALADRQPAGRAAGGGGDPAVDAGGVLGDALDGSVGQSDEPRSDRLRPHRRRRRGHGREHPAGSPPAPRRARGPNPGEGARGGAPGGAAGGLRRDHHHPGLPPHPGAARHRGQDVPAHGDDRGVRPGWPGAASSRTCARHPAGWRCWYRWCC